jgi:SAM-dependent methyltransferase
METAYRKGTYFSGVGKAGYEDYLSQEKSLRTTFRRFLGCLEKRGMTGGRMLEVGAGYGFFLAEARNFFSGLFGTEFSEEAGLHARRISGAQICGGGVSSLPASWQDFDVAVSINVIEHVYDPLGFVSAVRSRLKEGGRVILATPDVGSFWYLLMKKSWPSFKVPEHVAYYSRRTLASLLEKTGFRDIRPVPFAHAFPLGLIGSKLGISLPVIMGRRSFILPKTMTAFAAVR